MHNDTMHNSASICIEFSGCSTMDTSVHTGSIPEGTFYTIGPGAPQRCMALPRPRYRGQRLASYYRFVRRLELLTLCV